MINEIWSWLEINFAAKYDSHRIIFSPLAGSTPHNTFAFKAKNYDYQETFIFVQGLDSYSQSFSGRLSEKEQQGLFISNLFTEIDHNYVNPATNNYLSEIVPAFSNLKKWNQQVLQLYEDKESGEKLVDLYPDIIKWAAEHNKVFLDFSALIKN